MRWHRERNRSRRRAGGCPSPEPDGVVELGWGKRVLQTRTGVGRRQVSHVAQFLIMSGQAPGLSAGRNGGHNARVPRETAQVPDGLIGRARELSVLRDLLDRLPREGGALVLRGDAGIGKTVLLADAPARAKAAGFQVLTATGVQSETHLPFPGLHPLLRPTHWD